MYKNKNNKDRTHLVVVMPDFKLKNKEIDKVFIVSAETLIGRSVGEVCAFYFVFEKYLTYKILNK